jgi:UDP-N-acetyl-D-glucosamine/UDP-N-acetyl-D-galactosamine dehydrogenase
LASAETAHEEYGLKLTELTEFQNLDALVLAVNHRHYVSNIPSLFKMLKSDGLIIDVKSAIPAALLPATLKYWSL